MNHAPTIHPPHARDISRPSRTHIVVVFLRVPVFPISPPENHIATTILAHAIGGRLEAAGITVLETGASGPLEDAGFLFEISGSLGLALQTVRESLQMGLLPFATFGWLDSSEGVLREFFPRKGNLLELPIERASTREAIIDTLAQLRARKTGVKPSASQPPARHPRWNLFLHGLAAIFTALFRRTPRVP